MLRRVFPRLPAAAAALVGPGDDAAVLAATDNRYVLTTDLLVCGPDFSLAWSSPAELGWKAAATNLADVVAMGATPTGLLVGLAAPAATPLTDLQGIADGLRECCEALAPGAGVVGGDLSASAVLTLAITATGDLGGRAPVLRSGARVGDVVAYAGELGRAAAGLAVLFAEAVDAAGRPDAARAAALKRRSGDLLAAQLTPRPPLAAGLAAARAGATAMLDVSDGLVLDASRIAEASGVCIALEEQLLAADIRALAALHPLLGSRARDLVLTGGEDHGMLATFPPGVRLPGGFRLIGRVAVGDGVTVDGQRPPARGGWDPFADWSGPGA